MCDNLSYNIGPKIGIDGEAEFRKALQQLNAEYKTLQAQTKAVTAEYDKNGDEQGKLRAQSVQLQAQIKNQKDRLEMLTDAVKKSTDKYGENDTITQKWKRALYETQTVIAGLEKDLSDTGDALDSFQEDVDDSRNALEAFQEGTDDSGDAVKVFGDVLKANLLSDVISSGIQKLADLTRDFSSGMIDEAATLRATTAQFSQTFGSLSQDAQSELNALGSLTGISADRITASFTKIYAFAKTMGAESADALAISSRAMAAAADSAAYYDRAIEDVTDQLQSFLKGSYANDAALGISCTETTRNIAANEKYAKSFQALSESQKVDVLLSMVEAGNKASGALGQAARESDSWENVTGELENSWKKLQARLGEPALANATPLVQKLTDKLNQAGESAAFDKLADGMADTFGWLLDHSDNVLRSAGTIAAAILTFKVATSAAGWVNTMKTSINGLTAAMTANPVAVALTGIVALAGVVSSAVAESKERVNELTEASRALEETVAAVHSSYTDSVAAAAGTAETAKTYVDHLRDMQKQGLQTAAAHREYEMTVEALNSLIPELNLVLDEQTGLVEGGTNAIYAQIDAWQDLALAEAIRNRYKDTVAAWADAEAELYINQARLSMAVKETADVEKRLAKANEEYTRLDNQRIKALNDHNLTQEEQNGLVAIYDERMRELYGTIKGYETRQQELKDEQAACSQAIRDGEESLKTQRKAVEEATSAYKSYTSGLEDAGQQQQGYTDTVTAALEELQTAYDEAYAAANDSLTAQIGLFEDLSGECTQSLDDMLQALKSQEKAFNDYADNISLAVERGIDEGLVKELSDGTKESMLILQTLVSGSDEQIEELNQALAGVDEGRQRASDAIAGIQVDWDTKMGELQANAYADGQYVSEGFAQGIESQKARLEEAIRYVSNAARNQFLTTWEINSPSRVAADMARWIPLGAAEGVESETAAFISAVKKMYDVSSYTLPAVSSPYLPDYPAIVGSKKSVSIHLGGVQISLAAPQNTDLEALARLVGDTINEEAIRLAVAYG